MTENNEILFPEIIHGMRAGTIKAIEKARLTHTNLLIWRDGEAVEITPEEAELMVNEVKE